MAFLTSVKVSLELLLEKPEDSQRQIACPTEPIYVKIMIPNFAVRELYRLKKKKKNKN